MGIATNLCLLTLAVVFLVTEASPRYRYNDIIDAIERQGRPLAEVAEYPKDDMATTNCVCM